MLWWISLLDQYRIHMKRGWRKSGRILCGAAVSFLCVGAPGGSMPGALRGEQGKKNLSFSITQKQILYSFRDFLEIRLLCYKVKQEDSGKWFLRGETKKRKR